MKKDIEHVVTSTAMLVIAFILSPEVQPKRAAARRHRRTAIRNLVWCVGAALLLGALVWTINAYTAHVAFCAHLRVQALALPLRTAGSAPPRSLEYIDLSALGIEAVLLTAFVFVAIRSLRRRSVQHGRTPANDTIVRKTPLK